jgi:hypothetical protein
MTLILPFSSTARFFVKPVVPALAVEYHEPPALSVNMRVSHSKVVLISSIEVVSEG